MGVHVGQGGVGVDGTRVAVTHVVGVDDLVTATVVVRGVRVLVGLRVVGTGVDVTLGGTSVPITPGTLVGTGMTVAVTGGGGTRAVTRPIAKPTRRPAMAESIGTHTVREIEPSHLRRRRSATSSAAVW